jgi:hypothetical protein
MAPHLSLTLMSAVVEVVLSAAGRLVTSAGPVVAVVTVGKLVLDWWRRGPGRRRRWLRLFGRIALGVRGGYVIGMFGEPAYQQSYEGSRLAVDSDTSGIEEPATFTERVWLLAEDGYLQVLTDDQDNVVRYSLTTQSRKFRPKVPMGGAGGSPPEFAVVLGVTRFSELPWPSERLYIGYSGATTPYEYRQSYYYGRSGGYADWVCTYNASGFGSCQPIPREVRALPWNHSEGVSEWLHQLSDEERDQLDKGQMTTAVNTVSIENFLSDRSEASSYGANRELVRLMPRQPRLGRTGLQGSTNFRYSRGSRVRPGSARSQTSREEINYFRGFACRPAGK